MTVNIIIIRLTEYYFLPDVEPNDVLPTELDESGKINEISIN